MLTRSYLVHGAAATTVEKTVEIEGQTVVVPAPAVAIELVAHPDPDAGPGITLRYIPTDLAETLAEFVPGAVVSVTFEVQE